jgi:cystathionine beta-lyase
MAQIAAAQDVFVISDEIHCDFTFKRKHTVYSQVARTRRTRHLVAFSASKTFSLAGLNLASILVEDPGHRETFSCRVRTDGVNTHSTFGFAAAEAAYTRCDEWYEAMLAYVYDNFLALKTYLEARMPEVTVFDLEGTYLAWLDFRAVFNDHKMLEQSMIDQQLYLDEGYIFGHGGQGFERIDLACPRQVLLAALERLNKVYDRLKAGRNR